MLGSEYNLCCSNLSGPSRDRPRPRVREFLRPRPFPLGPRPQFTGKRLPLDRNALLYTVKNVIFDGKFFISCVKTKFRMPVGPRACKKRFSRKVEDTEKMQTVYFSGPLKALGPLITTLATPYLDCPELFVFNQVDACTCIFVRLFFRPRCAKM